MKKSNSFYSLAAAMLKAQGHIGIQKWNGTNNEQKKFVDFMKNNLNELTYLPEIESTASNDNTRVNRFLRNHGFDIELKPFSKSEFGVASSLKILVKWLETAKVVTITANKKSYPAIKLSKGVTFFNKPGNINPIVRIETDSSKSKQKTYLWIAIENFPANNFDLIAQAFDLMNSTTSQSENEKVIIPMIDFSHKTDLPWLLKLEAFGKMNEKWTIVQALQQNTLKLNQFGVEAKSGSAVSFDRSVDEPFIINKPFICWFTKEKVGHPIIAYYIDYENWKDPSKIG